ncbi:N-acetylmuramoyl-L-alanine amidase [Xaviernesmea oryzae]|uniref:N-acetylmuramoyl-L-alanine amidase n=1 Tax=Xaviernesmea oryzae TaxID=464029 RepID=A0A1Q9AZZ0_9HYPH|nr:N-acetylmuramoyl-L-alanine amidase [Xaviernesmea oryzae]OLP61289.1 N-acetylmuramoyl-L-alanine amidase [Xaviernesmea oryzae]SEL53867.1 N-acetylmuramoyl-L-alanine amidase [Xaviernesmea oryzae]
MSPFEPDFAGAHVAPSPNHGERIGFAAPDRIILHYTGMTTGQGALDWLRNPESQVSCHYLVHEDGRIDQLVPESRRAWHAGKSLWKGLDDNNSASIGIEIVNAGHPGGLPDYPDAQITAVAELCRDCVNRWSVAPEMVLAHSDIAPIRKVDPGEKFPWKNLYLTGVGHWVEPVPVGGGRFFQRGDRGQPIEAIQSMLALYGYGIDVTGDFCERTEGVIAAFQRHFRPEKIDGIADSSTLETLHRLLSSLQRFSA